MFAMFQTSPKGKLLSLMPGLLWRWRLQRTGEWFRLLIFITVALDKVFKKVDSLIWIMFKNFETTFLILKFSSWRWIFQMMECGVCKCWIHARCEGLSDEKYQILSFLPESVEFVCKWVLRCFSLCRTQIVFLFCSLCIRLIVSALTSLLLSFRTSFYLTCYLAVENSFLLFFQLLALISYCVCIISLILW